MVDRVAVLSPEECCAVAEQVKKLRRFWVRRHDELPSFTLGAAAYLDVPKGGLPMYETRTNVGNRFLTRHFTDVLQTVRDRVAERVDADVYLSERFGLPGFHIFEHHPNLGDARPKKHYDRQDVRLDWEDEIERRDGERMSFTMAIDLPAAGSGIYVWNYAYDRFVTRSEEELEEELAELGSEYVDYEVGAMVIHTGDQLHQIAPDRIIEEGEWRLTLQGHGRPTPRGFELYW